MQELTYTLGSDRRQLVDPQNFQLNWRNDNSNWVQARQYENAMRQVLVTVQNEDGSPFDLTGTNYWFEGLLPDGKHKILDAKDGVPIDPQAGQFRFDFPAQAFAVAGSYKQAFFRIVKDGTNIATLEFDMQVLADKVITDLIPSDYVTPFEDLYGQLDDIIANAGSDFQKALNDWTQKFTDLSSSLTIQSNSVKSALDNLEIKITQDGLATMKELVNYVKSNQDGTVTIDGKTDTLVTASNISQYIGSDDSEIITADKLETILADYVKVDPNTGYVDHTIKVHYGNLTIDDDVVGVNKWVLDEDTAIAQTAIYPANNYYVSDEEATS